MSKALEVLKIISTYLDEHTTVAVAIAVAEKIDALYTPLTPDTWAKANVSDFYVDRKIQFIKDIRAAIPGTSLVESKKAAEDAIADFNLARLREKLLDDSPAVYKPRLAATVNAPDPFTGVDDYTYATDSYLNEPSADEEDRAYAEYRERLSERAYGPLDEEPPF